VAATFLLAAAHLLVVGLTMLLRPGLVSMAAGAELLGGLELAGPYMFLLVAGLGAVIALGLWRLHRWARWLAILAAMIGVVLCCPVSPARCWISESESWSGAVWERSRG
jgi:uncharacterized membrane protein (DUF2068 family)